MNRLLQQSILYALDSGLTVEAISKILGHEVRIDNKIVENAYPAHSDKPFVESQAELYCWDQPT